MPPGMPAPRRRTGGQTSPFVSPCAGQGGAAFRSRRACCQMVAPGPGHRAGARRRLLPAVGQGFQPGARFQRRLGAFASGSASGRVVFLAAGFGASLVPGRTTPLGVPRGAAPAGCAGSASLQPSCPVVRAAPSGGLLDLARLQFVQPEWPVGDADQPVHRHADMFHRAADFRLRPSRRPTVSQALAP